ncbi:MAG: hypothetical protein WB791_07895, partial [Waddliaceae bacterium]
LRKKILKMQPCPAEQVRNVGFKTRYRIRLIIGFLTGPSPAGECAPHGALSAHTFTHKFYLTWRYPRETCLTGFKSVDLASMEKITQK